MQVNTISLQTPVAVFSIFTIFRALSISFGVGVLRNLASTLSSPLLVLSKRSSKEMDFLAAVSRVVVAICAEYSQVHGRVQPLIHNPPVVLAQQRANAANLRRGRKILREALNVFFHVSELVALGVNMHSFVDFYPAATELRTMIGNGVSTYLEKYRGAVTYLAFSTLRKKSTAGNDLPTELQAFLNENTPHIEEYIRTRYGERAFNTFQRFQNSLVEVIEGERRQGIAVQNGWPMKFLMRRFRRQPIYWLMYNLNFPVEGRMTWDQVSMWAIQCLRKRGDIEPPTWPIELEVLNGWNRDATGIWNEAVIEVYTDIRRRFCTIKSLHLAM